MAKNQLALPLLGTKAKAFVFVAHALASKNKRLERRAAAAAYGLSIPA